MARLTPAVNGGTLSLTKIAAQQQFLVDADDDHDDDEREPGRKWVRRGTGGVDASLVGADGVGTADQHDPEGGAGQGVEPRTGAAPEPQVGEELPVEIPPREQGDEGRRRAVDRQERECGGEADPAGSAGVDAVAGRQRRAADGQVHEKEATAGDEQAPRGPEPAGRRSEQRTDAIAHTNGADRSRSEAERTQRGRPRDAASGRSDDTGA
ncbi:hypothetical protein BRC99_03590 [Halobacteriales archaeon QS_7_69_60]|nr:MAG: hypothetical protein BRC99_03590 [Halobacteriales archaeon QS_7_69_60]